MVWHRKTICVHGWCFPMGKWVGVGNGNVCPWKLWGVGDGAAGKSSIWCIARSISSSSLTLACKNPAESRISSQFMLIQVSPYAFCQVSLSPRSESLKARAIVRRSSQRWYKLSTSGSLKIFALTSSWIRALQLSAHPYYLLADCCDTFIATLLAQPLRPQSRPSAEAKSKIEPSLLLIHDHWFISSCSTAYELASWLYNLNEHRLPVLMTWTCANALQRKWIGDGPKAI